MDRTQYNECIKESIKATELEGIPQKVKFCIVAKKCSDKVSSTEEATQICSQPKVPKALRMKPANPTASCEKDALLDANCITEHLDINLATANIDTLRMAIATTLLECRCRR